MATRIRFSLLVAFVFVGAGCVQMGDYVGVRHGYVTGGIKQSFGTGADKRNYLVTDGDVVLIVDDTKKAVQAKLGLPDATRKNIDGYDCWEYRERKLKLYFNEDSLRSWELR